MFNLAHSEKELVHLPDLKSFQGVLVEWLLAQEDARDHALLHLGLFDGMVIVDLTQRQCGS